LVVHGKLSVLVSVNGNINVNGHKPHENLSQAERVRKLDQQITVRSDSLSRTPSAPKTPRTKSFSRTTSAAMSFSRTASATDCVPSGEDHEEVSGTA
jgi:hypothetical protein